MPTNNSTKLATELSQGWLKYVIENDINDPTEDDIIEYLTAAGYEDLVVKKIMNDIQFTKHGKTKKQKSTLQSTDTDTAPSQEDAVLDIDKLSAAQISTLNKIKDVIRMKMTAKQRIDLRRYLENE